jgi:hypothetical protein
MSEKVKTVFATREAVPAPRVYEKVYGITHPDHGSGFVIARNSQEAIGLFVMNLKDAAGFAVDGGGNGGRSKLDVKPGDAWEREYKGTKYRLTVNDKGMFHLTGGDFDQAFESPTAAAKAILGPTNAKGNPTSVNGVDWWSIPKGESKADKLAKELAEAKAEIEALKAKKAKKAKHDDPTAAG